MLLVADDANAAYSNPRVLAKARRLPCRLSLQPTAPAPAPSAVTSSARHRNNTDGPCAAGVDANLNDMGYRGEDVSRTAHWAQARQSSPAGARQRGFVGHGPTTATTTTPRTARATDYQGGGGYGGYPQPEQGQYGQRDAYGPQPPYGGPPATTPAATTSRPTTATAAAGRAGTARPTTASRATPGSPSRDTARPGGASRGIRRRATATVSRTATRRGTPAGPTPPCPTVPTATRDGTPGTTGTAASLRPRPAPASPTPARTR